jgi:hypothetical protein
MWYHVAGNESNGDKRTSKIHYVEHPEWWTMCVGVSSFNLGAFREGLDYRNGKD